MIRAVAIAVLCAVSVASPAGAQAVVPPSIVPAGAPDPLHDPVGLFLHACLGGTMTPERAVTVLRRTGMYESLLDRPLAVLGGLGSTRRFDPSDPPGRDEPTFEVAAPEDVDGVGVCTVLLPNHGPSVAHRRLEPMLRGWAPIYSRDVSVGPSVGDHPEDAWIVRTTDGPRLLIITCPIFPQFPTSEESPPPMAFLTVSEIPPLLAMALRIGDGPVPGELSVPIGPSWNADLACGPASGVGEPL